MSESAEQNDGSAALRAVTTVIYTRDAGRNRDKRCDVRICLFIFHPNKALVVHSPQTPSQPGKETLNVSTIRNW